MMRQLTVKLLIGLFCLTQTGFAEEGASLAKPGADKLITFKWRSQNRQAAYFAAADVNGDGVRDLIAPLAFPEYETPGENVFALDGRDGRKIWGTEVYSDVVGSGDLSKRRYSPWAISLGDVNDNGTYQLVIGTRKGWNIVSLDLFTGKFLADSGVKKPGSDMYVWLSSEKLPQSAIIIDLDDEPGREIIMVGRNNGKIHFLDSRLKVKKEMSCPGGYHTCGADLSILDVDGDRVLDLFTGSGDDWKQTPAQQGSMIRIDTRTYTEKWRLPLGDNASSADPVLVDCDGDGKLEILKSVDNYGGDAPVNKLFCLDLNGKILWEYPVEEEDCPAVADMDFDGIPEIVGMSKYSEVYCLNVVDGKPVERWRVRAPTDSIHSKHNQLTPAIGDLDGDGELEIITATTAYVSVFDVKGKLLDSIKIDVGPDTYAISLVNLDEDDFMEAVVAGTGGVLVFDTKGYGPLDDRITSKRDYRRNNIYPWNYEDTYFTYKVEKSGVKLLADSVVLKKIEVPRQSAALAKEDDSGTYLQEGILTTDKLALPKGFRFTKLIYHSLEPKGASIQADILNEKGKVIQKGIKSGDKLDIKASPVRLKFTLRANKNRAVTPELQDYTLEFGR